MTDYQRGQRNVLVHGFEVFLAGCRHRGEPVSEQRLLDALVDERHLAQLVAQAQAGGGTYLRLVDGTGRTAAVRLINPAPWWDALPRLRRDLAAETGTTGENLQIWMGSAWVGLPDTGQPPAPGAGRERVTR